MTGALLDAEIRVDRGGFALDAALHAEPGEILALMGPSGAGKSTLLSVIAGFIRLSAGAVRLDDDTVQDAVGIDIPPRERGVILLGQQPRLFPHLNARENIAFGPRAHGAPKAQARADADGWLARIGLADLGDRRPARLSGGQQQRVALARALATSPRVLLLDEPLTSLDPATADGIRTLLRDELAATGTTVVMATHDAADAVALADRLVILEAGRITADGTPAAVLDAPVTPFAAALARTVPGTDPTWQARADRIEATADGIRVRVRTADGEFHDLRLPPGSPVVQGSLISIHPPVP
ncbi:molybdate transport system ATP-binding protein [Microbacterium sp. W4I4]|uniref:sulfate/molybdate ABC transporter ATP-binding protein n=1 Tax=Microbacterium sp. W4I4 TaxID=3042295 RepID=UPI00277D4F06|nr:ATP-binding cassette domain-containing protein [Microbacterium sp. W4I4]MDQ0615659.1 molybdate transport system ATP-binding protein [Microbacterium sp. W4I4]